MYSGDEERGGGMMGGFGGSMGGVGGNSKAKRPINVKFEIPYFTTSGIQVRYLKIIEPKVCQNCKPRVRGVDVCSSCNIHRCRGCDISHNPATLRSGCRMSHIRHERPHLAA